MIRIRKMYLGILGEAMTVKICSKIEFYANSRGIIYLRPDLG